MLIGTFVGRERLPLTSKEVEYLKGKLNQSMESCFQYIPHKLEIKEDGGGLFCKVIFNQGEWYRDKDKNLYFPKYISIKIIRQKGYDEAEVGKFYEWKEGFQPAYNKTSYSCYMEFIGDWRKYRGRFFERNTSLTISRYTYGTELDDLGITFLIQGYDIFMRLSKLDRRKYTDIKFY